MPNAYHKIGFKEASIVVLQSIAPPAISILVLIVSTYLRGESFSGPYIALGIIGALLFYLFTRSTLSDDRDALTSGWTIASQVSLAWVGVVGILLLLGYITKESAAYSRQILLVWFVATPTALIGALVFLRQGLRRMLTASGNARKAIIAGVNEVSIRLASNIEERPEFGLEFHGFFDDRSIDRLGDIQPEKLCGSFADLPDFANHENIDLIFIAIPMNHLQRAKDALNSLRDTTASVYLVPDLFMFDLIQARVDDLHGVPVVGICETPFHGGRAILKRFSDLVLASLMLAVALPTMLLIALGIKLTSPGSILFRQRRYGLDGREIIVYKFRTMLVSEDGEKVVQATRNDSRITPLGYFLRRYSLDELPQLINVLQGRMSVVGPRPHAVAHNEEYRKQIPGYMIRYKVAPGITGLAQINGCRGETANLESMARRVEYDLEYLTHWSLLLDIKILLRTLAIIFWDKKAY